MTPTKPALPTQRLVPHLIVHDGEAAIRFYVAALGARLCLRIPDGARVGHAELELDGTRFMLADAYPELGHQSPRALGGAAVALTLYVADVDALAERAVAEGARLLRPISDQRYGERVAQLEDPFGHRWSLHTKLEELTDDEVAARFAEGG